ncbi:citrate (Si)-synthase [Bacteroidota bacterium]
MTTLKQKLSEKINVERPRIRNLIKEHCDTVIDQVTVTKLFGGMRGLKCLVTDISYLDPEEGIRYRGHTLPDVFENLPKPPGAEMPYVEGLYYLLLTGDIPTQKEVADLCDEFKKRSTLPGYVCEVIDSFPPQSHPMTIFSAAIIAMHKESIFDTKFHGGVSKLEYWDSTYEDSMNLLAKLPEIAAYIYTKLYHGGKRIQPDSNLDFGANFAHMMGKNKPYDEVSRMYFILHADHESGNVSAHTGHLVSSALSDIYLSISSMVNGLAGPLHGLANQTVLQWIMELQKKMDGKLPSEEEMKQFVWDTLNSGQVIPGYGHAVLRKTDPRYTMQREFALKHMKEDPLFTFVDMLYKVVPPILQEHGKAKNPWPNVDAHSGVIQMHYDVTEYDFYTVMFGVGRALGVCANIIWDRALGYSIERPKSLTTAMIEDIITKK